MAVKNLLIRGGADFSGIQREMSKTQKTLSSFQTNVSKIMKGVGVTLAAIGVGKLVKDSLNASSDLEGAMLGLKSILDGQGRSFTNANKFIQDYIKDGLVPLADAVGAYKNLAARGYDDKQIQQVMSRLKDSAAFGRQSGLSLGEAVKTATEGLKNENSVLVDNAGVTKNVAKMWDEYAKSIGTSRDKLTDQQKIQAEVNGIMKETQWQVGDAAKYTETYAGRVAALKKTLQDVKVNLGNAFMPIANIILPLLQVLANGLVRVTSVFAQFSQALFGKANNAQAQTKAADKQALAVGNLGDAAEGAGKKAKKAGKDAQQSLAGFDEINSLSKDKSNDDGEEDLGEGGIGNIGGTIPLDFETNAPDITNKIQGMVSNVKTILADIFKPFQESWQTYGSSITTNLTETINNIKTLLLSIGDTLKTIWDVYGQAITDNLMINLNSLIEILNKVSEVLLNTWRNPNVQNSLLTLGGIFTDIWTILTRINTEILKPIVMDFLDLLDPSKNPSTNNFYEGLSKILSKVKDLTDYLAGDGFKYVKDFLELFLAFKVTQFVISMGLATKSVVANTAAFIGNTIAMAANIAKRIGDFIVSLAKSIYQLGLSAAALIAEALTLDGATIAQYALNLAMSLNPIGLVVAAIAGLVAIFITAYEKCDWFRNLVNDTWSDFKKGFSGLVDWFKNKWDALWNLKIPKIKLPHFKMDGEFGLKPPSVPSLDVDWYDKGGIFNSPQIIGVGEKRPEFVGALDDLRGLLGSELDKRSINNSEGYTSNNNDRPIEITFQVGYTTLGKAVIDSVNKVQRQAGKTLLEL